MLTARWIAARVTMTLRFRRGGCLPVAAAGIADGGTLGGCRIIHGSITALHRRDGWGVHALLRLGDTRDCQQLGCEARATARTRTSRLFLMRTTRTRYCLVLVSYQYSCMVGVYGYVMYRRSS